MIEALGENGGKIAVLHLKQAESCILRVRGFTGVIHEHNTTAKTKVVAAKLIRTLTDVTGATTLLISHDVPQCMAISDWVVLMATGGRIVAQGTPAELMDSDEPEVRQFVRGEPDGPIKFHYPAPPVAVDFGLETLR
jgi:hypothetical protein